jgi:hypothetical protein
MRRIFALILGCMAAVAACTPAGPDYPAGAVATDLPSYPGALRLAAAMTPGVEGEVPPVILAVSQEAVSQLQGYILADIGPRGLDQEEQQKARAYAARLGAVLDEVLIETTPSVRARMAEHLSPGLTADEAEAIATFFESPAGSSWLAEMAGWSMERQAEGKGDPSMIEAAARTLAPSPDARQVHIMAFTRSPGGKAFKRESRRFDSLVARAVEETVQTPMQRRVCLDMCEQVSVRYCTGAC